MVFWITLWTFVLLVGVGIFAVLSVIVIFGGAADIRSLFRALDTQHEQKGRPPAPAAPRDAE